MVDELVDHELGASTGARFVPASQELLAPSGAKARYAANVEAIRLSRRIEDEGRSATAPEKAVLARWSSWGALPEVFDHTKDAWTAERAELRELLDDKEWAQARRTTLNAHYTDPAYVAATWGALGRLGFAGGDVLEPGSGAGTFVGLAPEHARMTGVELDQVTAAISKAIYPHATIRAESFADTRFPTGHFDAVVGNVPFADVVLHDPTHNRGGHALHNHFIIKSLELTRPGGLVAVLTSRYTLDAQNPAARREMNQLADLVGAVRLPSGAHRRAAGTEAVTDLVVFRRRDPGVPPASVLWETVTARQIDGHLVKLNSYFDTRPENILGELHVGTGMYGAETLHVAAGDLHETPARLRSALDGVIADAEEHRLLGAPRSVSSIAQKAEYRPAPEQHWDGTILPDGRADFALVQAGGLEPLKVPKTAAAELRTLLGLRDQAAALLDRESVERDDTDELEHARSGLRLDWQRYVARYGPINRYSLRSTGRVDPETGEPGTARITPTAVRLLRRDPRGALVLALERFDDADQTAAPAALLQKRVVVPRTIRDGADTPAEAVAMSLDQTGRVELRIIAHLLGTSEPEARRHLGELVYDSPAGGLIHSAEYLSGNVRQKLDAARTAAADDDRYRVNVTALERVMPPEIRADEIQARMGAVWISPEVHREFLRDILADRSITVENPLPAKWTVKGNRHSVRATSEWGTGRRSAIDIAQSVLSQAPIRVEDEIKDDGSTRMVLNPTETAAAQEKAELMQERFGEWVWENPERARELAAEYNRRFNSIVLRDYTGDGDHLTLPGLAAGFTPRPHQRAAVARMLAEPSVLLAHVVGAGKTAEMVMGTMELKRMGMVSKPVVVVPNHMLEQFGREWLQIYPQARILAASSDDLAGEARRLFVARVAANDWDAVIMTRTAFQRVPLSAAAESEFIDRELVTLRDALDKVDPEMRSTIKEIEKAIARAEEQHKRLVDQPRDPGIIFESTGIDYVVVDEMHDYKNLKTISSIPDAKIEGAARATDLLMKLEYLRARHGARVATVATATPIANSVTEAHVMQRYLRPDLLEDAGVLAFDAWAATFGKTVTEMEMAPAAGGRFRMKTRFASFQNVPEMLRMWHVFADVKTAEDLNLPVPRIRQREDGQRLPETIVIAPSSELQGYVAGLGDRADAIAQRRVTPDVDNMLKVTTDGRKAALDMRMVSPLSVPTSTTKLDQVAATVARIWHVNRENEYIDQETGQPSPNRGALQLLFCDLGTPNAERWNAYDELRLRLTDHGVPAEQIRFIHEARNDTEKARMFAAARSGHIAVLIGSTSRMGMGTNVQARAVALHHVDCPWRPADVEQRDGRIVRQLNQNDEVGVYRYVVEGSFDGYMWETVSRKAKFIAQIMRGRLDVREIEDIGDTALSTAETKALASGNPLLLEQSTVANEVAKLQRLERAWHRDQSNLVHTKEHMTRRLELLDVELDALQVAEPRAIDTSEDRFRMTVAGHEFGKRADAAAAITDWAARTQIRYLPVHVERPLGNLGNLGGFDIDAMATSIAGRPAVVVELRDVPGAAVHIPRDEFGSGTLGLVRQLEHRTASIPRLIADTERRRAEATQSLDDADRQLGQPFKRQEELREAQRRLDRVNTELAKLAAPEPTTEAPVPATPERKTESIDVRARRLLQTEDQATESTTIGLTQTPRREIGW
ncbi:helicase [Agromyces sp. Soil535]|nr:helicase [Agromyces sp. Soil535]